jgi:hypothetical protein
MPRPTTDINLARALKLKNRMIHRLGQLDAILTTNNSTVEGSADYDVRRVYKARLIAAADLVALKVAITRANEPVQSLIFELAECKTLIALLNRLSTKHGVSFEGYSGARVNYVAQMRKPDVDREVVRVEREIDRIQTELDGYNYRTTIAVPEAWLAEGETDPEAILAGYDQARRSAEDGSAGV